MIDWTRVNELRLEIGEEGFAEVVELFLDEVEEVVMRLVAAGGGAAFGADLHFLKGSAWNLGFAEFGALCHDGERKVARAQGAAVDIGQLAGCYNRSKQAFLAGLREIAQGRVPTAA
jgi:HPt (histidine-containing phosphotransfer) domain-containing protein